VTLVELWRAAENDLPENWRTADIRLQLLDPETVERALALLGPAQPYRVEPGVFRFSSARDGSAQGPDGIQRLLARLDKEIIIGTLSIADSTTAPTRPEPGPSSLVESWDAALAGLPADWSDLLCEATLDSTDYIERAAVLCIQINPRRDGTGAALRFRCARVAGYGVAPGMARRCFERCEAEGISGSVTVLRALSDTQHVATQGPVWQLAGKTV
jgi:hypothetical protein